MLYSTAAAALGGAGTLGGAGGLGGAGLGTRGLGGTGLGGSGGVGGGTYSAAAKAAKYGTHNLFKDLKIRLMLLPTLQCEKH